MNRIDYSNKLSFNQRIIEAIIKAKEDNRKPIMLSRCTGKKYTEEQLKKYKEGLSVIRD